MRHDREPMSINPCRENTEAVLPVDLENNVTDLQIRLLRPSAGRHTDDRHVPRREVPRLEAERLTRRSVANHFKRLVLWMQRNP